LRIIACLFLVAAALCACAVVEAPSGGPEDKTPASVQAVFPASDSVGVARNTQLAIEFSEKIDAESFKNKLHVYPPNEFSKIKSDGNRLLVTFREEFPETTVCVVLKSGFRDEHNVENRKNYSFYFSTADRIATGGISGKILFKQKPDSTGIAMAVELKGDTIRDLYSARESRIAFADGFGNYLFRALPADSSMFLVWAFIDSDRDGRFSYGKEFWASRPDTILLTGSGDNARGIDMNIIDPDEPAVIKGVVLNNSGLPLNPFVRFVNIDPAGRAYSSSTDTSGAFVIGKVKPGRYVFHAFIDMRADSLPGQYTDPADSSMIFVEPSLTPQDTLSVSPGQQMVLDPVSIGKE